MIRLLALCVFLIVANIQLQAQDSNNEQLTKERTIIVHKIDSLNTRLIEIDNLLSAVSGEDREAAMIAKYGKNKGKMVAERKAWTSMSFDMARDSWGEPEKIQKSQVTSGMTEKWTYPNGRYLFFKNGLLESWKE